jgi:outer membrane protein assembly factor BamB
VRWTQPAGHGIATDLTLLGDRLFAVTLDDELLALDVRSGVPAWRFASGASNESFRMTSTPAIVDGRVFFGGLDGVVYAFDAETGSPLWKRPLGASVTTSVLADGGSLYAGTEDRRLHRLTPSTGEILASLHIEDRPWGRLLAGGPCLLSLLGEDAAARPGIGCASLDLERLAWSYAPEGKLSSARPYLWRGFVVIGDESGKVLGVRLSDGSPGWSIQVEGVVRGIGIMGDVAYIGTVKGRLYARRIAEAPPRLPKVSERAASSLPARAR